ncbi:peroxisome assembly protein 12 [Vespula maculifrons]|uniref:Peroxisome assembly protein 12 n=1 Tax=Vespula maculifrons TaxID=7453 RepID=A0ABD2CEA3_VESMC
MAEKGAHLTGTTCTKPSIFEIIAQESLAYTLEPAFKKILSFVISFNPERYGHLLEWSDEGYLIFNTFLQRYYFSKYSASFSETFYGLKRISLIDKKFHDQLSAKQKYLSLMFLVLLPYFREKLSKLSYRYKLQEADNYIPKSKWERFFKKCVIQGHNIYFTLYESITLCNYILYVSGRSMYATPLLRFLGIVLTYSETRNIVPITELLHKVRSSSFTISDGLDIIQTTVARSFEIGAFFLQFLSWWTQENYFTDIMALPAPSAPKVRHSAVKYKGLCPLCMKVPHIRTVLMVSGYIFCYQCILSEVRNKKRCPVTNYPANENDLIRLYI